MEPQKESQSHHNSSAPLCFSSWCDAVRQNVCAYHGNPRSLLPFAYRSQFKTSRLILDCPGRLALFPLICIFRPGISCWVKKRIWFPAQPRHPGTEPPAWGAGEKSHLLHPTWHQLDLQQHWPQGFHYKTIVRLKPFHPLSFSFSCVCIAVPTLCQRSSVFLCE